MFDGLKDKLSSFRKDAAEEVEEKAAEAEAESEAGEPAEADEGAEAPDQRAETEASADATSGSAAGETEPAPAESTETTESAEPAEPAEPGEDDAVEAESDPEGESDAEGESGGGSAASRFKRAKAVVTGKVIIEEEDLEEPLRDLEFALLGSDVEMTVAEEILDSVRESMLGEARAQIQTTDELVTEALHDALLEVIAVGQFDFEERIANAEKPVTIVFTGVNGVGKTTTIAKLSEWLEERGYTSVLANGDTYRAGANEQIREHAEALDRKLIAHEKGGDPAAVIYDGVEYADAHDIDVVLGDTAGRLHTSNDLMAQLEKIDRVVEPDLTLFVDESVAGQDAVRRATEFNDAAEIDGVVLSKADADASGGAAISIAYVTGKPVLFLGTGQGYDDLALFEPEALVDELVGEE